MSEPGAGLRFELDMLDAGQVANPGHVDAVREQARGSLAHPLHRPTIAEFATRLVNVLDAAGTYVESDDAPAPDTAPVAAFAPAVILRKRSAQGILQVLQTIGRQLEEAGSVPDGLLPLVDPDHTPATTAAADDGALVMLDDDPFLPLPVNETQLKILRRVDSHAQTLIQGPPVINGS